MAREPPIPSALCRPPMPPLPPMPQIPPIPPMPQIPDIVADDGLDDETPVIFPYLSDEDLFGAIFAFTDFPRISRKEAIKDFADQCREVGFEQISPAAIFTIEYVNAKSLEEQGVDFTNLKEVQRQAEYERTFRR